VGLVEVGGARTLLIVPMPAYHGSAKNGHFALSVTDTGPGIPLDQQNRIFEQFHQVDSSNTKAKGGTSNRQADSRDAWRSYLGRFNLG
jgi:signal transduction histidine kinase